MENVTVKELFEQFEFYHPEDMTPCRWLYNVFKTLFLNRFGQAGLIDFNNLSLAGDDTPVYAATRNVKKRTYR